MSFFDWVHVGTRHGQIKCLTRDMRDLRVGSVTGPVVSPDGLTSLPSAAIAMMEGGYVVVRDEVLVDWTDEAPADLVIVSKFGRPGPPNYPAHIVAAIADSLAEDREHCPVCRSLVS